MRRGDREPTLLRHGRGARIGHAVLAVTVLALIVSGLGLAGLLPAPLLAVLGGHTRMAWLHRQLGLAFGVALGVAVLLGPPGLRRLLSDMLTVGRGELAWLRGFARYCLRPSRHTPPYHDGRFDPAERLVFAAMLLSTAVLIVSGAVLYVVPAGPPLLLGWAIRVHVAAAAVLVVTLGTHVVVGSGVLPSHRGVARVMFGDGHIPVALARRLWPGWTERQLATQESRDGEDGERGPSHDEPADRTDDSTPALGSPGRGATQTGAPRPTRLGASSGHRTEGVRPGAPRRLADR